MKRIKLFLVLMVTVLSSMAHDFEVDGIYYNVLSDTTVAVTYKGGSESAYSNEYSGEVIIPDTVYNNNKYLVTEIGEYCFYDCPIESIVVPNSIIKIGIGAFNDCTTLKQCILKDGIETLSLMYKSSVDGLFYDCPLETIYCGRNLSYNSRYGYSPFYNNTTAQFVILNKFSTTIYEYFLRKCSAPITILSDVPPTVTTTSFASGTTIYVPETAKQNYLNASNWNRYNIIGCQILDINSGVSLTGTVAFSGSGSGTENDPFLIFNPVQLNDVRNSVGYSGIYYKLMSDIDMTEWIAENNPSQGWQPIGNASSMFKGIFIGNGKKITGLTINRSTTDYAGLFGYVYNASISDLTVEGEVNGNNYTGGLIGKANSSTITNCHFNGNVTGNSNTGGITGLLYNSVLKSSNHNGTVAGNAEFTGGIIGEMIWACVDSCQQTGNVTGNGDYTGGICGKAEVYSSDISLTEGTFTYSANDNNTISNVTAYGDIIGQSHTGGISGAIINRYKTNTTVTLSNCSHEGVISGVKYVSGVVGYNQIENSTNSTTFNYCQHKGKITAQSHIGGIIGYDTQSGSGTIEITNCNLKGDLTATAGGAIGGIIGYASSSGNRNISNCYALSMIQAKEDYAGGIAGQIEGGNNTISDCYFSGNINANQYIGGLCGKASATTIKYSYSNTSLLNGVSYVGGIAGYADANSSIYSCVSADEKINATNNYVGRIYGDVAQGATIGEMGTTTENKALATATVNLNGVQQNLADGAQHGTNVGRSTLRLRSTYQGIGWDFASNWANQETESYPYKPAQTAPPVIQCTTTSGGTTISGKGMTDATIYVSIGKHMYSTKVSDNQWNLTVDPMQSGALITVYAEAPGLDESYRVYQLVNYIGNGTADDPYQIYTADDLANINGLGYYKIMNDIDLTEWIDTNSPTQGWLPIGRNGNVMSNLIGDNHKISGLWIDSEDDYVALMAMADNITITDLTVETDTTKGVNGGSFSGIIIGKAINGRIINCRANGIVKSTGDYVAGIVGYSSGVLFNECSAKVNITGNKYLGGITGIANDSIATCQSSATITGANYIGGLVGKTSSPIINCFAIDSITGVNNTADTCYTGGLAGFSSANISLSYSKGYISQESTGTECYAGGIVGYNDGAAVSNCYSTAKTSSSQYAAGIAGYNTGTIDKCYASGNISAYLYGAGIVGYNDGEAATTSNCVSSNKILAVSDETGIAMRVIGGIKNNAPTPETNNYALKTMAVSVNDVTQKIYDDVLHGIGQDQAVLMQRATYSALGWNMDNVWTINEGNSYPYLLDSPTEIVKVGSIEFDYTSYILEVGSSFTITPTITPEDANDKTLQWKSSNDAVATVTENGIVTAISVGSATITATTVDGTGLSATCEVTIIEPDVNYLTSDDHSVNAGTNYSMPIELINEVAITAFQCDIYLPAGIEISTIDGEYDVLLSSRATSSHTIASALQSDGSIRILAYSTTSKAFSGNSGELFNINLFISEEFEGDSQILVKNVVITTPDEVEFKPQDFAVNIDIIKYILGDTNNDLIVNVTDIVRVANYILGYEPAAFIFDAADISGDGNINVSDIVGVSNIILNGSTSTASISSYSLIHSEDAISINDLSIIPGETKTIEICLNNATPYTAYQFDVMLPYGLYASNALLTKRAASTHNLMYRIQDNGTFRVLSYSTNNDNFSGNDGAILYLNVYADDNFNGGEIYIDNILFAEKNMNESCLDDESAIVSIPAGVENRYFKSSIYAKGRNIVIESPVNQAITISSLDGISTSHEVIAGKNIIPTINPGLYIVSSENCNQKVIIK